MTAKKKIRRPTAIATVSPMALFPDDTSAAPNEEKKFLVRHTEAVIAKAKAQTRRRATQWAYTRVDAMEEGYEVPDANTFDEHVIMSQHLTDDQAIAIALERYTRKEAKYFCAAITSTCGECKKALPKREESTCCSAAVAVQGNVCLKCGKLAFIEKDLELSFEEGGWHTGCCKAGFDQHPLVCTACVKPCIAHVVRMKCEKHPAATVHEQECGNEIRYGIGVDGFCRRHPQAKIIKKEFVRVPSHATVGVDSEGRRLVAMWMGDGEPKYQPEF